MSNFQETTSDNLELNSDVDLDSNLDLGSIEQPSDVSNPVHLALREIISLARAPAYQPNFFENLPNVYGPTFTFSEPLTFSISNGENDYYLQDIIIDSEEQKCSICLVDFKKYETVKKLPCKHIFHHSCILTWVEEHNTCPFCRSKLE